MKLNWLIRKCADSIFYEDLHISSQPDNNIFYSLQTKFNKLHGILDFQELFSELSDAKKVFQQSDHTKLLVKKNMTTLVSVHGAF